MNKKLFGRLKWAHRFVSRLLFFPFIIGDYVRFGKLSKKNLDRRFKLSYRDSYPFVFDKTITTPFDRHYVYHTSWAARKVNEINPDFHVDISSSLYFCSIVSAFVPVRFYDYRPAVLNLNGLESNRGDLLDLPFESNSITSLSCMHTIEHIGLGRYGDKLDPNGDLKAIKELKRVVKKGGSLLFVVPVGKPLMRFNSMRIYSYEQIMKYFEDMKLVEFSLIHEFEEDGGLTINASKEMSDKEDYGCGCFWFIKV